MHTEIANKQLKAAVPANRLRFWHYRFMRRLAIMSFLLAMLISTTGCVVYPSELTSLDDGIGRSASEGIIVETEPNEDTTDAREIIKQAIEYTNEHPDTQKFWFSGYVRNTMEQSVVTSMFDGVMIRPLHASLVNARIAGQPFQYYQYDGERFVRHQNEWYEITDERTLPFDPFEGFSSWVPLMEHATFIENTNVLGIPTQAYEVRIRGDEWIKNADTDLFESVKEKLNDEEQLQQLLEQTIVKVTLWIGRDEPILYQYETWIVMPLPDGGYFDQKSYVQFFRYDDPSIESLIPATSTIRDWIEKMEKMEKQAEEEQE